MAGNLLLCACKHFKPYKRSTMQATREKLRRRSEKKRTPNEYERIERRTAYVPNDNDEENDERDIQLEVEDGSESAVVERRGNDYYGSRRTDDKLEYFVVRQLASCSQLRPTPQSRSSTRS